MLSETPMPSLDQINAQPEFEGRSITKDEFEKVWRRAWEWFEDDNSPARSDVDRPPEREQHA